MIIDKYDSNGRTPLMNAVIDGDYDTVKQFLDLGADPNITDNDFGTSKAEDFAAREAKTSKIHKKIYDLLVSSNPHSRAMQETPELEADMAAAIVEIKPLVQSTNIELLMINIILFPFRLVWNIIVTGLIIAGFIFWFGFIFGSVVGVILILIFAPDLFLLPLLLVPMYTSMWDE